METKVQAALAFGGPLKPLDRQDPKRSKVDETVKSEGVQEVYVAVIPAMPVILRTLPSGSSLCASREQQYEQSSIASRTQGREAEKCRCQN